MSPKALFLPLSLKNLRKKFNAILIIFTSSQNFYEIERIDQVFDEA